MLAVAETDQVHALGVAPDNGNFLHARANERAAAGDEHRLVLGRDDAGTHDHAVTRAHLDRDHALATAAVFRVLRERRTFAVAVARGGQHRGLGGLVRCGDDERDH